MASPTHPLSRGRPQHRPPHPPQLETYLRSNQRDPLGFSPRHVGSVRGIHRDRIRAISHYARHVFLARRTRGMHRERQQCARRAEDEAIRKFHTFHLSCKLMSSLKNNHAPLYPQSKKTSHTHFEALKPLPSPPVSTLILQILHLNSQILRNKRIALFAAKHARGEQKRY